MTRYLLTFDSTHDGIAARSRLKGRFPFTMMPAPREVSSSCGIALRLEEADFAGAYGFLLAHGLEARRLHAYRMETAEGRSRFLPCEPPL